jgi:O-antigen/teichoic acid export membrane protein
MSSNTKLAAKNIFFATSVLFSQVLGTTLIFFVIARIPNIGVAEFGMLTYSIVLAQLVATFFEYGLISYIAQSTARAKVNEKRYERAAYGLHLFLMGAGYLVFWVSCQMLSMSPELYMVCLWAGGSVFVTSTLRFFCSFYQGREKIHIEFVGTLSEMCVVLAVTYFVFLQNSDVIEVAKYLFLGRSIAWVFSYLIFSSFEYYIVPIFDRKIWKQIIVDAMPFCLTFTMAIAITSVDTVMLKALAPANPEYQVGLFQAALKLILIPTILGFIATKVFLPQMVRLHQELPHQTVDNLKSLNNVLQTVGFMTAIFCFHNASTLIVFTFGDRYVEAVELMQILSATLMLRFGAAYNLYFVIYGMMWKRTLFATLALISLVILNIILIPRFGAKGSAYASVFAGVIYLIPFMVVLKASENSFFLGWNWIKTFLIGVIYFAALWLMADIYFLVQFLFSAGFISLTTYLSLPSWLRLKVSNLLQDKFKLTRDFH